MFASRFIFPSEYAQYGLPNSAQQPDIDNLVGLASSKIDDECGKVDGDGNGSLVYTTYQQRILCQSGLRQFYYLPHRPLAIVDSALISTLQELDTQNADGNENVDQIYYSGFLPSPVLTNGTQSAILSASGKLGYGRRGREGFMSLGLQSLIYSTDMVLLAGPDAWFPIDINMLDYDSKTGELHLYENLFYGYNFSEINVTYNAGYDPRYIPRQIKYVCAQVVKNLIVKMGVSGLINYQSGRAAVNAQFLPDIIDGNIKDMLRNFTSSKVG